MVAEPKQDCLKEFKNYIQVYLNWPKKNIPYVYWTFLEKRWNDLANLVTSQSSKSVFYNDPKMEYFIWLGLIAEINLKKWLKARKKLNFLEELGVKNRDKLSRAYFRLNLEEKNFFSAWTKWVEIEDDILREKSLRELMHFAIGNDDIKFLQSKLTR